MILQRDGLAGDPELPGTVEAFPLDLVAWVCVLVGAWLLLQQVRRAIQSWSARRPVPQAPVVDVDALEASLHTLINAVENLSADQKAEAFLLGQLVRGVCSERWTRDCAAMTDAELLHHAAEEQQFKMRPLLQLSSEVLFADRLFEAQVWSTTVQDLRVWMMSTSEVPSA